MSPRSRRTVTLWKFLVSSSASAIAVLMLVACGPMLRGSGSSPPPAGRGESCYDRRISCKAGLTCVSFHQNNATGDGATCELPCGECGACPAGMSSGDRGDRFWGAAARNGCLGEPTPAPPAPAPPPADSGDGGVPVDADMSGTWMKAP